jgi:hypothetical protein
MHQALMFYHQNIKTYCNAILQAIGLGQIKWLGLAFITQLVVARS